MKARAVVTSLSFDFDAYLRYFAEYCLKTAAEEPSPEKYQWFRPSWISDLTDNVQISNPYGIGDLPQLSETYIDQAYADAASVTSGDYALLSVQNDILISAARAFNERHTLKFRHFAHADGVNARIGDPKEGIIYNGLYSYCADLLKNNVGLK